MTRRTTRTIWRCTATAHASKKCLTHVSSSCRRSMLSSIFATVRVEDTLRSMSRSKEFKSKESARWLSSSSIARASEWVKSSAMGLENHSTSDRECKQLITETFQRDKEPWTKEASTSYSVILKIVTCNSTCSCKNLRSRGKCGLLTSLNCRTTLKPTQCTTSHISSSWTTNASLKIKSWEVQVKSRAKCNRN